jgi:hypothetical protein
VSSESGWTKKSLLNVCGRVVSTPSDEPPALAPGSRRPPTRDGHLRSAQRQQVRAIEHQVLGGQAAAAGQVVAEPVGDGLHRSEEVRVGVLLGGVDAPPRERDLDVVPPAVAACCTPADPPSTITSAGETCLPLPFCAVEQGLDPLERRQHGLEVGGQHRRGAHRGALVRPRDRPRPVLGLPVVRRPGSW